MYLKYIYLVFKIWINYIWSIESHQREPVQKLDYSKVEQVSKAAFQNHRKINIETQKQTLNN